MLRPHPKPNTFRSKKYLESIRQHRCLICGTDQNVIAHHEGLGDNMMGSKPPDTHCVPLCTNCHAIRHGLGWRGWYEERFDVSKEIIKLLTEYIQEREEK